MFDRINFYQERLFPWFFSVQKYVWFEKDLSIKEKSVQAKIPVDIRYYSIQEREEKDWGEKEVLQLRGRPGLEQFEKRWKRGDVLGAAYQNGQLTSFVWIKKHPESYRRNEGNWAHTYDGWTFERYRGNWLLPVLQQALFDYCRTEWKGITHIDTFVLTRNIPSLKGDSRAGYIPKSIFLQLRIIGQTFKFRLNDRLPQVLLQPNTYIHNSS